MTLLSAVAHGTLLDMGNRSRRRTGERPNEKWARNAQDPLKGIPDTNMPYLADIRIARALQGQRGWRRAYAWISLVMVLAGPTWLIVLIVRWLVGAYG
jgi:hypothetical protein